MKFAIFTRKSGPVASIPLILLMGLGAVSPVWAAENAKPAVNPGYDLLWGLKIPMRDGVQLNGTVYKPKDQAAPVPVIFTLTPYIADTYHERGTYFSTNGYVFVLVDVRGRGNSQGTFTPFLQEARDGHDVVEFLARQPWCDGQVAMWGGSYAGYDQWATAKELPPHLKTIVPAAAAFAGVDFPFLQNIFPPYYIQWLTLTSGATPNDKLFEDQSFWIEKFRQLYLSHRPFRELDRIVGNTSTVGHTWLNHPLSDAYWDAYNPSDEQFARINLPILTITGHYDDDQPGTMEFYKRHMRFALPEALEKHYLLIGPWNHTGTRTPKTEFDGLKVGEVSKLNMNALHKAWYDWTMKGGPRPEFLKKRVAYYVPGAEVWKFADSLEAITTNKLTLHLDSVGGHPNDVFHSGLLNASKPVGSVPDQYVYDPLDVRPAELERFEITNSITDQRYALNLFGNGLVYHSEPFTEVTELAGYAKFTAWIALDVPDTDFSVTLYEVLADGSSILLTQDQMRARYRESARQEKLIKAGEINQYVFDGFTFFARQLAKGSRLRLVLTCPNSIYTQKNYNSGGAVVDESGKDARTAHVALYHDAEHPSTLELPAVK